MGPHPSLFGLPDGLQAVDDGLLVIGRDEGVGSLDRKTVLLDEFPCPCDVRGNRDEELVAVISKEGDVVDRTEVSVIS